MILNIGGNWEAVKKVPEDDDWGIDICLIYSENCFRRSGQIGV